MGEGPPGRERESATGEEMQYGSRVALRRGMDTEEGEEREGKNKGNGQLDTKRATKCKKVYVAERERKEEQGGGKEDRREIGMRMGGEVYEERNRERHM